MQSSFYHSTDEIKRGQHKSGIPPYIRYGISKEQLDQFGFYSIYPHPVKDDKRSEIMRFLHRLNFGMELANFEFDLDDGEIRLKSVLLVEHGKPSTTLLQKLMDSNLSLMDRYRSEIDEVLI